MSATVNAQNVILPPNAIESEEAVLGAMLIDPDTVLKVSELIAPEDFYLVRNGLICQAIYELQATQQDIDILTIANRLQHMTPPLHMVIDRQSPDVLSFVGGEGYLAQLTNSVPTAQNALTYAGEVRECSARRRMIESASTIARLAYDRKTPLNIAVERASAAFGKAVALATITNRLTYAEAVDMWFDDLERFMVEGKIKGIDTGFPALNGVTGGYVNTKLYLVTAPTGGGKTSWLKSAALKASREGLHVGIWSLEMSEEEYIGALISEFADIDLLPENLLKHSADKRTRTLDRMRYEKEKLKGLPIHLHYRPGMRMDQFALEAQMLKRAGQLDLIIFDYIQLARPPLGFIGNREQEVATVANTLKDVCGQLRVPGVAGAQLNDDGELRESRAIEMACDVHVQLDPKQTSSNKYGHLLQRMIATIRKNRSGAKRKIVIMHNLSHRKMGEIQETAPNPNGVAPAPVQGDPSEAH